MAGVIIKSIVSISFSSGESSQTEAKRVLKNELKYAKQLCEIFDMTMKTESVGTYEDGPIGPYRDLVFIVTFEKVFTGFNLISDHVVALKYYANVHRAKDFKDQMKVFHNPED